MVNLLKGQYSAEEIHSKERQILNALNFDLGRPISLAFLRRFSQVGNFDGIVVVENHNLAKLILEVALTEYSLAHILPSKIAAAALMLAIRTIKGMHHRDASIPIVRECCLGLSLADIGQLLRYFDKVLAWIYEVIQLPLSLVFE